jgi:hypothetical protein
MNAHARQRSPQTSLPLLVTFATLLAWSLYAYATVRVNADIVAEAIQVQQWMDDPWWVWSYPGQRHGGVIEYPFIALAEWMSPGNVYGFTLLRVLYIPLVGLLLGLSVRWAFPRWSLWPFALAAVVGPGVLHGFRMISDLYPFGWLLSASGIALTYAVWSGRIRRARAPILLVAGILVGLGIYQHASAAIFSIALLAAGAFHWRTSLRTSVWSVFGLAIGLIPMAIALFGQPDVPVVYSPTNPGPPNLLGIFGLSGSPDAWRLALVPNGWGVQQADESLLGIPWSAQVIVNAIATVGVVALIVPLIRVVRRRARASIAFLSIMWTTATVMMIVMVSIVSPIWYYGTGLGFLVWVTLAALPATTVRPFALSITAIVIAASAAVSARAVLLAEPLLIEGAQFKLGQARFNEQIAAGVEDAGVRYLYGDYWEVLPIAYASAGAIAPITYDSNRFPLDLATPDTIIVGLASGYLSTPPTLSRWTSAAEAESLVTDNCTERSDINISLPDGVRAFECQRAILSPQ